MFATLFARSMTKVIVGCPGLPDNVFIYCNIPKEEMEYFEPNANYYMHMVQFLDPDFFEDLIEKFPIFKNTTFLLYTDKLLSAIGKHSGDLSTMKMYDNGVKIFISVAQKDESILEVECGEIISAHLAMQYKHVFDEHKIDPVCAREQDLLGVIQKDAPFSFIDIDHFTDRTGKCALLSNGSGVSIKEFPNKADLFEYSYSMLTVEQGTTVEINTVFKCPIVDVVSVQPAVVWFTKSKKEKDITNA
jgi:hypothetical protein